MSKSARRSASGPSNSRRRISHVPDHSHRELIKIDGHPVDQVIADRFTRRVPPHQ
jgi:hypothetical protein